jgi:hypothetical protein
MPRFAVAELALDDDQRHAFAGHLYRVCVARLIRSKASPHTGRAAVRRSSARAPLAVQIRLTERERFVDAKPRSP